MYLLIKPFRAVTLFEMLLVLIMSSMIGVAAFKYERDQQQSLLADNFASKMYIFSQTVRQYVRDNQAAIEAGTFVPSPPVTTPSTFTQTVNNGKKTYVFTGVSWLTNPKLLRPNSKTPYFSSPFTFNDLNPLQLRTITGRAAVVGDNAVTVTITGPAITINYGLLYDVSNPNASAAPRAAVTASAATKAAGMFDLKLGASAFSYHGGTDTAGSPAPVVATLSTPNALDVYVHPNQPIASGDISFPADAPQGSAQIQNVQQINFNTAQTGSAIGGVNKIQFSTGTPITSAVLTGGGGNAPTTSTTPAAGGEIDNLGTLNFTTEASMAVVNQIQQVNFAANSMVNNVQTLYFDGTSSSAITGLSSVSFANSASTAPFMGIGPRQQFSIYSAANSGVLVGVSSSDLGHAVGTASTQMNSPVVLSDQSTPNTSTHFCLLSQFIFLDSMPQGNKGCSLTIGGNGSYNLMFNQMALCTVSCTSFTPTQAQPSMPSIGTSCQMVNGVMNCN